MKKTLKSILLVDDNTFDSEIVSMVLRKSDLTNDETKITTAENGEDAINKINAIVSDKTEPASDLYPQLILLDINMPKMNGFEFLEQLQPLIDQGKVKNTIVIMLTSSISNTDEQTAKKYSCVANFITKPITKKIIKEVIEPLFTDQ